MSIEQEAKNIEKALNSSFIMDGKKPLQQKENNAEIKINKRNDVFLEGLDDKENTPLGFSPINKREPLDVPEKKYWEYSYGPTNQSKDMDFFENSGFNLNFHTKPLFETRDKIQMNKIEPITENKISEKKEKPQIKTAECVDRDQDSSLKELQNELDRLRETHHRMFAVKGKIYQAVEKEINRFKTQLSDENEKKFTDLNNKIEELETIITKLTKECKSLSAERDKFQTVYYKLKTKIKTMNIK